ncbi:hypothetical protein [Mycolicibacter algericus]|uniref:Uncharacterized protein n=1 Tax=Mycolicibacter algericus DSM 45454 TaxID=723879 RepID=A0ABX3RY13_MYCAL|nr:hypothetical protein [Mycolicibacter algericus]OQZ99088.1 hypothetical protein BST10_02560 [Mycolicibacter algericus DSM 45454]
MGFIDGVEHGCPVLFGDSRLLRQACRSAVQSSPAAKMRRLGVHRLKQICLQRNAALGGR